MNRLLIATALSLFALLSAPLSAQIDFWTRTGGPEGGEVADFTETAQNFLFAGTPQGEIYRSDNDGENWELVFSRLEGTLTFLETDDQDRLYAGAETFEQFGRLYRSADNGESWSLIYEGPAMTALAFDPAGSIWAARGTNGMIRSVNDGIDWQDKNKGIDQQAFLGDIAIGPDGEVFVTATVEFTYSGVYKSVNAGNAWDFIGFGDAVVHAVETVNDDQVLLVTSTHGLHRSTDGGNSWKILLPFPAYDLVTHPDGQTYVLRWENGNEPSLYYSPSNGDALKKTAFSGWPRALFLRHNLSLFVNTNDKDEVLRSTDEGQTLQRKHRGLAASHVMEMVTDEAGVIYALTRGGVYRSFDDGQHWEASWIGLPQNALPRHIFAHPSGIIYLEIESKNGKRLYASFDGGETWGTTTLEGQVHSMATLGDQFAIAQTDDGVFRTFDNWNTSELLLTDVHAFQEGDDGKLYALRGVSLVVSDDFGTSWNTLGTISTSSDANASFSMRDLLITSDGMILVSAGFSLANGTITDAAVFRSQDQGQSWVPVIEGVFPNHIISGAEGKLYINPDGVLVSSDNGDTWTSRNDGLVFADIYGINGIQPASYPTMTITESGKIFAGSAGFGVFSGKTGIVSNQSTVQLHAQTEMELYPNPAIEQVQIEFSNDLNGEVQLQLIDIRGQVVDNRLIQKPAKSITYSYLLPTVPTGQYWIRFMHGNQIIARPLVIR